MNPDQEYRYPNSIKPLDIAPTEDAAPKRNLNQQTLIDRALDAGASAEQKSLKEKVIDAIRTVYDPEIPVNIYDLGLIYEIDISPEKQVMVKMTLTAPGCPVAGSLPAEVQARIQQIPEVAGADVELVWEPAWDRSRMSEAAALELGLM